MQQRPVAVVVGLPPRSLLFSLLLLLLLNLARVAHSATCTVRKAHECWYGSQTGNHATTTLYLRVEDADVSTYDADVTFRWSGSEDVSVYGGPYEANSGMLLMIERSHTWDVGGMRHGGYNVTFEESVGCETSVYNVNYLVYFPTDGGGGDCEFEDLGSTAMTETSVPTDAVSLLADALSHFFAISRVRICPQSYIMPSTCADVGSHMAPHDGRISRPIITPDSQTKPFCPPRTKRSPDPIIIPAVQEADERTNDDDASAKFAIDAPSINAPSLDHQADDDDAIAVPKSRDAHAVPYRDNYGGGGGADTEPHRGKSGARHVQTHQRCRYRDAAHLDPDPGPDFRIELADRVFHGRYS